MSKEIMWTDDQRKAIDHNSGTVLVSAAAGSGKTAVLVERIVKKLYTTDIDQYVIVTFTDAAASQMKKGISDKIKEKLSDPNLDNSVKNNLKKQLLLLPDASISTMHSFCSGLIRANFDKLDISSDFSIIQPEDRKIVFKSAYDEVTENLYEEKNVSFLSLVSCYCKKTNDDDLFKMAESLFEASCKMPYPEEWLSDSLKDLHKDNYLNSKWFTWFVGYLKNQVKGIKYRYENFKAFVENNPQLEKYDFFINDLNISENILKVLENEKINYGKLYNLFNIKFQTNSFKKDVSNSLEAEEFKKIRNEYKTSLKDIFDKFFLYDEETFLKFSDLAYTHAETLTELVIKIAEKFNSKKIDANVLDYNDLEHYAIKLLLDENHNPSEIAKEISSQYLEIIIDEYQDTNPVQEVIFNAISKNSENLFMVGDMKQSIYKFRNAEPTLFSQKVESYSFEEDASKRKIFLSQNFRSRNTILDFSNLIFGACMNKITGEIDYKDEECLHFGQETYKKEDDSPVEIMLIDDASEADDLTSTEKEANIIGLKIQQMVENRILVYDKSENALRPAEYKDFAILLRTAKNVVSVFSKELTNMGVPVFVDDNTYYLLSSYEIKILMSFLKVIDNHSDDIATATLLKSPIFNIDDDTLALISREDHPTFYTKAINYTPEQLHVKIKLDNFKNTISKYHKLKNYVAVEELLRDFLFETNFCEYVLNMTGGEQRVVNINYLLKCAGDFEAESFKGVYKFISYIENYDNKTASILSPKKMPDNLNSVTITTIHKSKGLEYPIVILANAGKKFNIAMAENIEFHNNLGFAFNCITENMLSLKSPVKSIIKEKKVTEEISEEMRILYVALTRAKERLIVSGTINVEKYFENLKMAAGETEDKLTSYATQTASSLLDWIGLALVRTTAFEKLNLDNSIMVKNSLKKISFVKANIINFDEFMTQTEEVLTENILQEDVDATDVSENLSYKYSHTANEIYTKYSVSSIKQNKSYVSNYHRHFEKLQASAQNDESLTPAEKGTLTHFILEKAVNNKIKSEEGLEKLISDLKDQMLVSSVEEKEINKKSIMNFITSHIGRKAVSSDEVYTEAPFEIFKDSSLVDENVTGVNILVQGVIDLYFKDDDTYVIVDYKTDNITDKNREERINTYKIQLDLYKSAVAKMHKTKNISSYIYFLNTNEFIEV